MSKKKVSIEDKMYAVNLYLDGKESRTVLPLCGGLREMKAIE